MICQVNIKDSSSNNQREGEFKVMITRKERKKNRLRVRCKLLVSLILLAFTTIAIRTNTYSWFTSSASSTINNIQVGTFELSLDNSSAVFGMENIEPGIATKEKVISFTNIGSINMLLKGQLSLDSTDFSGTEIGKKAYRIIAQVYKPINPGDADTEDNRIYIHKTVDQKRGETIESFNQGLLSELHANEDKALEESNPLVFKTNDKLICRLQLILDIEGAVSEHQGNKVTAKFEVKAKQNIDGGKFQ